SWYLKPFRRRQLLPLGELRLGDIVAFEVGIRHTNAKAILVTLSRLDRHVDDSHQAVLRHDQLLSLVHLLRNPYERFLQFRQRLLNQRILALTDLEQTRHDETGEHNPIERHLLVLAPEGVFRFGTTVAEEDERLEARGHIDRLPAVVSALHIQWLA